MRELLKRYRLLLLAALLCFALLIFYSYNLRQTNPSSFFERAVLSLTAPVQASLDGVIDRSGQIWNHYLWLSGVSQRNDELVRENRQLRAELAQTTETQLENERLRKLLGFVDELDLAALPALVIGEDTSSWARTLVLNKGAEDGLQVGLPVVSDQGLVGRIIKVSGRSARVLLIADASSAVGVLVQRTRTRGVIRGRGQSLSLDYALSDRDIAVGDLLVSSGMGGVFPKGLPVARVTSVEKDNFSLFQRVEAQAVCDFDHLEEVMVVVGGD